MRFLCIFYIKSPASPIFTDSSSAYVLSNVPQYNILKPNLAVFSQTVQPDKKFCFLYQVHYLCEHLHMIISLLFTVMLFAICVCLQWVRVKDSCRQHERKCNFEFLKKCIFCSNNESSQILSSFALMQNILNIH